MRDALAFVFGRGKQRGGKWHMTTEREREREREKERERERERPRV
jgi:hypothetical protein